MRRSCCALLLSLLALADTAPADAASFVGLPFNDAWDVTPDGRIVGGGSAAPMLWTAEGGVTPLPLPAGASAAAVRAVSNDGSVAVGVTLGVEEALRWDSDGVTVLSPSYSFGSGVSADGSVAVGRASNFPVRWDAGVATQLPGTTGGVAMGLTPDASTIVGQAFVPTSPEAVSWVDGTLSVLPNLGGGSAARAVSADASTIVGWVMPFGSGADQRAATWVGDALSMLDLLPGTYESDAWDVSADGSVMVGLSGTSIFTGTHAVFWDERGVHDITLLLENAGIDMTGWTLETATAVSANGRVIVGNGLNPDGLTRAWMAVIPEPGTGILLGLGVAALAHVRRRATRPAS